MKATLYFSMLFGPLICNVVCDTHKNITVHSEIANNENDSKFENNQLFHSNEYSSTKGVDRDNDRDILLEENDDNVLLLDDVSTLRSISKPGDNLKESDEFIVGEDYETNEDVLEINRDENSASFSRPVETIKELRDFMKTIAKRKLNKYTRLNVVKEIFPLTKTSNHTDKKLSEVEYKESLVKDMLDEEELFSNENITSQEQNRILKSKRNSTVNHFFCSTENGKDSVIAYGSRAWNFETQDVNLTLTYPLAQSHDPEKKYVITGFSVLLVTDGVHSKGYINSGGVLCDHISLSFISPGISSLLYEFQVYGIPRYSIIDVDPLNTFFYLCS